MTRANNARLTSLIHSTRLRTESFRIGHTRSEKDDVHFLLISKDQTIAVIGDLPELKPQLLLHSSILAE